MLSGQALTAEMWDKWAESAKPPTEFMDQQLLAAGADRGTGQALLTGINYTCHDVILQLGVEEFECPRRDWPSNFRLAGTVQSRPPSGVTQDPDFSWWGESEIQFMSGCRGPRKKEGHRGGS